MSDATVKVLTDITLERVRQEDKWGGIEHDDRHNPLDWHDMVSDYIGWARRMMCMGSPDKARNRLVQVAALIVAWIEAIDRRFPPQTSTSKGDPHAR